MIQRENTHCGYIGIIGRPNVGKSTLLNRLIGQKISITSDKPQTTRHRLLGIKTIDDYQYVYVDTPGLHQGEKRELNRAMNRAALSAIMDVDVILYLIDASQKFDDQLFILEKLKRSSRPIILAINKVDKLKSKNDLLPLIDDLKTKVDFADIFPISAKNGTNLDALESALATFLPLSPHYFPEDQITDRNERFIISEIIREKLFRATGQELPYATTVMIEKMELKKDIYHIAALILVEREGQKKIVIGHKGEKIKEIATIARHDIEKMLEKKVFLQVWVKIKTGWTDDSKLLYQLGYGD